MLMAREIMKLVKLFQISNMISLSIECLLKHISWILSEIYFIEKKPDVNLFFLPKKVFILEFNSNSRSKVR